MKIIDCFTFFNELDLLEFRLKLLDPYIDHFVIAESNLTHSGSLKPFHFEKEKERFKPWLHKILYIPFHQTAEGLVFDANETKYNPGSASWKLENEQRNALSAAGPLLSDDDRVLLSDLDEIPDPRILKTQTGMDSPKALSMLFHYYFMNCQNVGADRWWNGTIICSGRSFRELGPQQLRDNRNEYPSIKKAGWHFSYLGGLEKIKYKIRSFAHTEFNKEEFTNDENIMKAISKGEDIFKRPGVKYKFVSIYYYPDFLRMVMSEYPSFLYLKGMRTGWQSIFYSIKRLL